MWPTRPSVSDSARRKESNVMEKYREWLRQCDVVPPRVPPIHIFPEEEEESKSDNVPENRES